MRGMLTVLTGRPALIEHQLWSIQVQGDSGRATVWMHDPNRQSIDREILVTFVMKRMSGQWRITGLGYQPYLHALDVQEEVE
jgi:hypothetical protein